VRWVLEVFPLDEVFSPVHCRGGASPFVLKQKDQKFKTEKTFCPQGQLPARFSVGPLRAWMVGAFSNCHCCEEERRSNLFTLQSELTSRTLAVAHVSDELEQTADRARGVDIADLWIEELMQ